MKHSPWATSTVAATIPIAILIGIYLRQLRPGRVLEASFLGVILLLFSVVMGGWIDHLPLVRRCFDHDGLTLAWCVIAYGLLAAVSPVWLLLAPRDYLSTFVKLGTVTLLAIAIIVLHPVIKMPALTPYIDGTGPIFGGALFPFVFITIACGAVSGFHALIASGTTPKLLTNERDIRMIGYGGMLLESFVAIMALIAATVLEPGVYFAINTPLGVVSDTFSNLYSASAEQMHTLAQQMGESSLYARTGGAPSLAVGMASIFGRLFGDGLLSLWYHFAIMFEAVFILTTVDAGTRVGRFMLQDLLGNLWPKMADTSWTPSVVITSSLVVMGWGYFLYIGVIDPNGGVNILWPLFGISNQMLAAIALCVASGILVKSGKFKYVWVTGLPLAWLTIVTTTAAWEKICSTDVRVGFFAAAQDLADKLASGILPAEKVQIAPRLIFNLHLDAWLTLFLSGLLWLIVLDTVRVCLRHLAGKTILPLSETHYVQRLPE